MSTLEADGAGSLRAALEASEPRIVVFEVGGVIDLRGASLRVDEPYLTIAGQTAPPPGITLIRGGLRIATHDVVVQHLRVRPGEAGHAKQSGWEVDGITTAGGARDVVVDHCSISWATDENLTATGPRFEGAGASEWRRATSNRIRFTHNVVAEALSLSTHGDGEHSKGTLIHDNVTDVLIAGNLYAHNVERNPLFKGGARGIVMNNLIYDPGAKAVHYALRAEEWNGRPFETGAMVVLHNVLKLGPASAPELALVLVEGDGPLELYAHGNLLLDRAGRALDESRLVVDPRGLCTRSERPPAWASGAEPLAASDVLEWVLATAGARPWDRDEIDRRIVREAREGSGGVRHAEAEGGGYPRARPTRRAFRAEEWDLDSMERKSPEPTRGK